MSETGYYFRTVIGAMFDPDELPGCMTLHSSWRDRRIVPGLLDFWAHSVDGVASPVSDAQQDLRYKRSRYVPREFGGHRRRGKHLLGFDFGHTLSTRPLTNIRKTAEYKEAAKLWWSFVRFARLGGVDVPPTRLWIVCEEVKG